MSIVFIRTLILYLVVIIAMRIMGKRQIGEMQPSELVVTIMISDLASIPMQANNIPIIAGIIPILTLVVSEIIISYASFHSPKFRKIVSGSPSTIIRNGELNYKEMERIRMSLDDLLEELRIAECPKIKDVKIAMVETNGKLSIEKTGGAN